MLGNEHARHLRLLECHVTVEDEVDRGLHQRAPVRRWFGGLGEVIEPAPEELVSSLDHRSVYPGVLTWVNEVGIPIASYNTVANLNY